MILFLMMLSMIITVDAFTMVTLIIFKYKFVTLKNYFEDLKEDVERICAIGNSEMAAEKLAIGLLEGVVMHKELLRLSKEIDKAFGTVMACQLCQSSGSAVSLLLQIAASLLSDSIFYCGWHMCPTRSRGRNLRKIVSIACVQAQRPLVMKAFKMLKLTYATFLQVIRGTYSVFALFYAQNK
ncbi:unnamed protein product [Leptosia nina]|uniref:Uncharacterized protein n=1 Tax=Leptosia nina TaxID=320188 RepID=A0AAV1IY18_9NEOP